VCMTVAFSENLHFVHLDPPSCLPAQAVILTQLTRLPT
jgi:hypothetical protein